MRSRARFAAILVVGFATAGGGIGACKSRQAEPEAPEAGGASPPSSMAHVTDSGLVMLPVVRVLDDAGPISTVLPVPVAKIEGMVNPNNAAPYAGPKGMVEGVVRTSGDPPPKRDLTIPFECGEAYATYGKAFREGNGRAVADALVAVTGYDGYVPAAGEAYPVSIHGCAFDRRTIAMTYGQRIDVSNRDPKMTFLPTLNGGSSPAQLVAIPRGDAVKLYPTEVGHYALVDGMNRNWMYADVFVLRYATHAVTGLDGRFRIAGIPAGKVKVSAYLPPIDAGLHADVGIAQSSVDREVEVKDGETTTVDFELPYRKPKPAPPPPKPTGKPGPYIR